MPKKKSETEESLATERRELVIKKHSEGLTPRESNRLRAIESQLDRMDASVENLTSHYKEMQALAARFIKTAEEIQKICAQISKDWKERHNA